MSNNIGAPSDFAEMGLGLKCSVRDETQTLNLWGGECRGVSNMERQTVSFGGG